MPNKIKHLEMIQAIINRFSSNCFLIKGWSITVFTGLMAYYFTGKNKSIISLVILFVLVLLFYLMDCYYLNQERKFRHLYDSVRNLEEDKITFSMTNEYYKNKHFNFSISMVNYCVMLVILMVLLYIQASSTINGIVCKVAHFLLRLLE